MNADWNGPSPDTGRRRDRPGARLLRDDEHRTWQVFEYTDPRGETALIFESDTAFRRVAAYPPDWRELSESELLRLSWRR